MLLFKEVSLAVFLLGKKKNLTPQFIIWVNEAAENEVNSVPQEGESIVKSR